MQQTLIGRAKSIAGAALIGLGLFVFYENLHQAATQFSHLLGDIPGEALGMLPSAILVACRVLKYGAVQPRPLQGCLLHMLASSWPLLLVVVGTVLSRDGSTDSVNAPGPFSETKELIAGFWLWQVHEGEAEIEIRQVFEAEDFGSELTPDLKKREERLHKQIASRK